MDSVRVAAWVDRYIQAWNGNDAADIGRLFTADAVYYTGPFALPWRGREAIVRGWLDRRDAPGSTTFRYEVLASTADTGISRGWTRYHNPPGEYSNIWLIRFDLHGQCREFTEWGMERPVSRDSNIVVSQVSTVSKMQLGEYIGSLTEQRVDQILAGMRFLQVFTEGR